MHLTASSPLRSSPPARKSPQFGIVHPAPPPQTTPHLFMHHQVQPNRGTTIGALVSRWFGREQKSATYLGHDQFGPVYHDKFFATHLEVNTPQQEKDKLLNLLSQLGSNNPNWNKELVRRSRISANTLKLTLYYLSEKSGNLRLDNVPDLNQKKILVAMLILASKYLQDRTYSSRAWSTLTGLPTREINRIERETLEHLEHRLYVPIETFDAWSQAHGLNVTGST